MRMTLKRVKRRKRMRRKAEKAVEVMRMAVEMFLVAVALTVLMGWVLAAAIFPFAYIREVTTEEKDAVMEEDAAVREDMQKEHVFTIMRKVE